uniref:Uncharacterized protein n=1 Tax=Podarcis muralis TaxID=64176 RepID=A0A670ISK9_PODMU
MTKPLLANQSSARKRRLPSCRSGTFLSTCTLTCFRTATLAGCIPCGPGKKGNCFGPSICCGEEFGCYFGTPETLRCLEENYLPSPCEAGGKPCSAGGRCAASGICCNDESCTTDAACVDENSDRSRMLSERNLTVLDSSAGDLLLKLMHMANANRQQQGKQQFY